MINSDPLLEALAPLVIVNSLWPSLKTFYVDVVVAIRIHIHRYPNIFDLFMPMLAILSNVDSHHVFVALTEFETIRVSMVLTT